MPKYDLSTPESIAASAKIASNHANRQPNQSGYNAAWMHGYAEALKDVSQQLSLDLTKQDSDFPRVNSPEHSIRLWARVGMTLYVSKETYNQLLQADNGNLLQEVITGQKGQAILDGEAYFPDIDENMKLAEREYDLYDNRPLGFSHAHNKLVLPNLSNANSNLNDMIQGASARSSEAISSDSVQKTKDISHEI